MVRRASTAAPSTAPVSACNPLGMSIASTGTPAPLMPAMQAAISAPTGRARPVPSIASTITSTPRTHSGDHARVLPPLAT